MPETPATVYLQGNQLYIGSGVTIIVGGRKQMLGAPFTSTLTGQPVDPDTVKFAAMHEDGTVVQGIYQGDSDPSLTWTYQGVGRYLITWTPPKPGSWTYCLFADGGAQAAVVRSVIIHPNPLLF